MQLSHFPQFRVSFLFLVSLLTQLLPSHNSLIYIAWFTHSLCAYNFACIFLWLHCVFFYPMESIFHPFSKLISFMCGSPFGHVLMNCFLKIWLQNIYCASCTLIQAICRDRFNALEHVARWLPVALYTLSHNYFDWCWAPIYLLCSSHNVTTITMTIAVTCTLFPLA